MRRALIWRRIAAVLALFLSLGVLGVALPGTASAVPGLPDCRTAPTPEVPGRGVEAFFAPAPAAPPPAADPFAADSKVSIFSQYGYAGLRWNTYDLGCTGTSAEASVGTTVANWLFTLPKAVASATGALLSAAYEPSFLTVFDPLVQTVVDALRKSVFDQWAGLVLAGLGFLIVWRARQSSLRTTAAALGWALFVMMVATVLFRWPVEAGKAADATVTTTMSAVTSALGQNDASGRTATGDLAASDLHDALLYQVWLGGQFGDANSVTARRYGPALFDSQALTWSEAATLNADPAAGQRIIEAKKAKYKQVAAQVQAADPDAYEYLTGRRSDARIGFAALALLAVACAVPFLLIASLLVIGALVITRFSVMLFPAIATLGLFPAMRSLVIGVGNTVAAAVINAMVFGIGTAVMVKAFGVVMAPGNGLPSWLVVALVLLLTIVMWYALRPFQRLTGMVSPGQHEHGADAAGALGSVTRGLGRVSGRLASTAAGVLAGDRSTKAKDADEDADDARTKRRAEADPQGDAQGPSDSDGADDADSRGGDESPAGQGAGSSGSGGIGGSGRGKALAGGGRSETQPAARGPLDLLRRGNRRPDSGSDSGSGSSSGGDQLVAAEVGLATSASAGTAAGVRRAAEASRPGPSRRPGSAGRPAARPATSAGASAATRGGGRAPVRRSEGADLDDVGVWAPAARGLTASEAAGDVIDLSADPSYEYRPEERRSDRHGGRRG